MYESPDEYYMDIEYLKEHAASVSHNIQRTIYLTNDTVKYRLY